MRAVPPLHAAGLSQRDNRYRYVGSTLLSGSADPVYCAIKEKLCRRKAGRARNTAGHSPAPRMQTSLF